MHLPRRKVSRSRRIESCELTLPSISHGNGWKSDTHHILAHLDALMIQHDPTKCPQILCSTSAEFGSGVSSPAARSRCFCQSTARVARRPRSKVCKPRQNPKEPTGAVLIDMKIMKDPTYEIWQLHISELFFLWGSGMNCLNHPIGVGCCVNFSVLLRRGNSKSIAKGAKLK
jgi:hypothetical protein